MSTSLSTDTVRTTSASPQISFDVDANVTSTNPVSNITVTLFNPLNENVGVFQLQNVGGSNYSGNVSVSSISCLLVGIYKVQIVAEDNLGLFSNLVINTIPVVNTSNQSPIVSGLIMPDTINIPSSGTDIYVLSVVANDPDGYCDLMNTQFNSFLPPNGQPSSGNPFTMFDDGNIELHGDTVALDSRFSLKIGIPSTVTQTGYYVFKYKATDRSGVSSAELVDSILVKFP